MSATAAKYRESIPRGHTPPRQTPARGSFVDALYRSIHPYAIIQPQTAWPCRPADGDQTVAKTIVVARSVCKTNTVSDMSLFN